MLTLYGKHNSKCSVYINLFDPQQFFEVGTIIIIIPIYSCIQRVSDLPGYQQQGTLCACPMLYSFSVFGSLAPPKGKIITRALFHYGISN